MRSLRTLFHFVSWSIALTLASTVLPPAAAVDLAAQAPVLAGRVYAGNVGDTSTPLAGVTVELYGSNDLGYLGERFAWTTTDATGWYDLEAEPIWEFYNIVEIDPSGYVSMGASSVDGTVVDANRIRFAYPLAAQTLTGNRFWDRRPSAPTSTPTSTLLPAPVLSGRVYEGEVGDHSTPLSGVAVRLHASNDAGVLGAQIDETTTDGNGWYGLDAAPGYEYYYIVEVDPAGFESVGAASVDGTVVNANRIRYGHPLAGKVLTGNMFWDRWPPSDTVTPQPTHTRTLTASPTATPTATRTQLPGETRTPSPTPTLPASDEPSIERTFTGTVLEPGDEGDRPVGGVRVALYGSEHPGELGVPLGHTRAERDGTFWLTALSQPEFEMPFYTLVVDDPNWIPIGASPGEGGVPVGDHWIRFEHPPSGQYPDNTFFVEPKPGEPEPRDPPVIVPGWALPLPQPTPAPGNVDFFIRGVEVTQAIQCFVTAQGYKKCPNNYLPLTAGKLTAVRVYVGCTGCTGTSVNVKVRLMRAYCSKGTATMPGGCSSWGGPATLQNYTLPLGVGLQALRDRNDGSATWILPTYSGESQLSLFATVNRGSDKTHPETDMSDNHEWLQRPLYTRQPLNIKWALLDMGTTLADAKHAGASSYWMSRIYPMPVKYSQSGNIKYSGTIDTSLLKHLDTVYNVMNPKPDILLAWLPKNEGCYGRAWIPGETAYTGQCWDVGTSAVLASHEVGHNLGMSHPDEKDSSGAWKEPCWPFPGDSTLQETGYDPVSKDRIVGMSKPGASGANDVMDSSSGAWVAPYTWMRWLGSSYSEKWAKVGSYCASPGSTDTWECSAPQDEPHYLAEPVAAMLVSGQVLGDGSGELDPCFEMPSEGPFPSPKPGGTYCLEFRSIPGATLSSHCFELAQSTPSGGGLETSGDFSFLLPLPSEAGRVVLRRGEQVLVERADTVHPPWAAVLEPQEGARVEGMATVAWESGDGDGDPLSFVVLYSHDGGGSWLPLTVHELGHSLQVDTTRWPGSDDARIRILVSDGFHTAIVESGTFEVPRKAPQAWIDTPRDGAHIHLYESFTLIGHADDAEDGVLEGDALTWISDRQGFLARGEQLALPSGWLEAGEHTITLEARDRDGMVGQEQVRVFVGLPVYLPAIRKA